MIYQLQNQQDAAKAIYQLNSDTTVGQLHVSDFQWFITTIIEAIDNKLVVDLRYDTSTGLNVHKGIIKSAELTYNSGSPNPSTLTITFNNKTANKTEILTYTFNAELVEENTNSVPGSFMKYYINDNNHQVIVGIIVYYK